MRNERGGVAGAQRDRYSGRRGPTQARQHDIISHGLQALRDAQERESEIAAAVREALLPMVGTSLDADALKEIANRAASAVSTVLAHRDGDDIVAALPRALRAGMCATEHLLAMSRAMDEVMPAGGWPTASAQYFDGPAVARKHVDDAWRSLAQALAVLDAEPERAPAADSDSVAGGGAR